jgi:hypothetical protein
MRRFVFNRKEDIGGVSGTGIVAEGAQFANGKVAIAWLTKHTSVAIYDNMETVEAIHGHRGSTDIVWLDAPDGKPLVGMQEVKVVATPDFNSDGNCQ